MAPFQNLVLQYIVDDEMRQIRFFFIKKYVLH